jgi:hypothetical protein
LASAVATSTKITLPARRSATDAAAHAIPAVETERRRSSSSYRRGRTPAVRA